MELKLPLERAKQLGLKNLEKFGMSERSWNWKGMGAIDLRKLSETQLKDLRLLLTNHKEVHGVKMMLYDLGCYERAKSDPTSVKVRNIRSFAPLLQTYLSKLPNHHVYIKDEDDERIRLPHYVNRIAYHPRTVSYGAVSPAYVTMDLIWQQFGGRQHKQVTWHKRDVRQQTVAEILTATSIYLETEDFREAYSDELKRWDGAAGKLGKQYLASGIGHDDCDGNGKQRSYWNRYQEFALTRDDGPSKVIIDLFYEEEKPKAESGTEVDTEFWTKAVEVKKDSVRDRDEDEELSELEEEEEEFEANAVSSISEVPVHPYLVVFDLRRHLRLVVHINQLSEYVYDTKISDKLILPQESKHLVHILVEHRDGGFRDIVKGKGGGAIVLLSGPPGVGKTLTAEVYAESEERALYSVQASQLGTNEEELEKQLTKVLARGKRWNAVMLIDEADVYVHKRGDNLQQNAIVGVFLRVLEYHAGVLFLTTNRADLIDDAIASRCVARINYQVPPKEDQAKIWKVLSQASGIKLGEKEIATIVDQNNKFSGRDIKNLLKLAQLYVASGDQKAITADVIKFVRQFKPTNDLEEGR